jgi:hypothetical protein
MASLKKYKEKRAFERTPEPVGGKPGEKKQFGQKENPGKWPGSTN